jgi:hypothetical protein
MVYVLGALALAAGAAYVIREKRRAHEEWVAQTGGVITGEARGDPSKQGVVQGSGTIAPFAPGGAPARRRLVEDPRTEVHERPSDGGILIRASSGRSAIRLPEEGTVRLVTDPSRVGFGQDIAVDVAGNVTLNFRGITPASGVALRGRRLRVGEILGYPTLGVSGPTTYGFVFAVTTNAWSLGQWRSADPLVYLHARNYEV